MEKNIELFLDDLVMKSQITKLENKNRIRKLTWNNYFHTVRINGRQMKNTVY